MRSIIYDYEGYLFPWISVASMGAICYSWIRIIYMRVLGPNHVAGSITLSLWYLLIWDTLLYDSYVFYSEYFPEYSPG